MTAPPPQDRPPAPSDTERDDTGEPYAAPLQSDDTKHHPRVQPSSDGSSSTAGPSDLPWIPSAAVSSPDHYGGLNPENLATLDLMKTVPAPDPSLRVSRLNYLGKMSTKARVDAFPPEYQMQESNDYGVVGSGAPRLLALPSELIDTILKYLSPLDLASASAVCQQLRRHALSDMLWQAIVQEHVPGCRVRKSYPRQSFMDLYAAHDGVWFLPKFKIWFCDWDMPGSVVLCRYDQRRGCIEGLRLVAVARDVVYSRWPENETVVIHTFTPLVTVHVENPILQLNAGDALAPSGSAAEGGEASSRFSKQILMTSSEDLVYSRFALTKPLDEHTAQTKLLEDHPYGYIWPPPTIPAHHHVSGSGCDRANEYPTRRSEVSDQTFRIWRGIRRRFDFSPSPAEIRLPPVLASSSSTFNAERNLTYSTLDPVLYTPTPTKPWRGIWVGDYTAHGCEFLLIHQPDDPPATDAELNLVRSGAETDAEWERRRLEARIYRGRLEAIKLTGDANVPRGEYSFIAHNLGPDGLIGVAEHPPFIGARRVHSTGHIAGTGFVDDKFIESQLFLINENRLAQYWIEYGFITYFERVNIDDFLDPERR